MDVLQIERTKLLNEKKTNKKGINDRINEDKIRFACHFRYFLVNSLQLFIDLSKVYSINHDL
jgi:hypothetical protein